MKSSYFVNTGILSVLAVQPDGKSVEVGLIGNEGFLGLPSVMCFSQVGASVLQSTAFWGTRGAAISAVETPPRNV
jgi:CRP-like cAMP-binding protein